MTSLNSRLAWLLALLGLLSLRGTADAQANDRVDRYGDPLPHGAVARLGTVRLRFGHEVESAAISSDGAILIASGRVCDAKSGKELQQFKGKSLRGIAVFADDGKTVSIGQPDRVQRWELASGTLLGETKWPATRSNPRAVFTPDLMVVAVTEMTDKVRVFDTATGKMIWERQPASRIALAPDGKMAAFLDRDDKLVLWDLAENRQLRNWKAHDQNPGQTYQFSPDGKTLASTAMRRDIRFWDVASGKMISEIKGAWGSHLRFSPDGRAILYCWEDAIHLRDVKSGAEIRRFVGHGSWIAHAAFSRNGKHLITGSRDHTTILWDVATGKELHDFQGHRGAVNAIAFSPKGDLFASGGGDHALIVWDLAKHRPRHIFSDHDIDVNSLAFHPDGVRVATGDGSFGHTDREAYLRIWDIEKGKLERKFFAHMGMVGSVHYVADGKQLVSAGADRRIRVWDADTGNRLHQFRTPDLTSRLVLSRDRKTLMQFGLTVGASSRWDIATWKELPIGELEDFPSAISRHDRNVMAYSPDGALRAFCPVDFRDFAISLHDNKTGKLICKLLGHTSFVNSLAFSPDSRTLASGSADTTILLWDVAAIKK